jgi:carboxyl-terminal processing protease
MNVCFPDVCATPPAGAPVPYVNLGMNATAVPFAVKTFFSCVNALNQGSQVPMTLGDQAGAMSPFMGPGQVTLGNPKVFVEALPGTNLTCPAAGNNMIAPMGAVLVPSVTNVFFTLAGPAQEAEVSAEALAELSRALGAAPGEEAHALLPGGTAYLRIPIFSPGTPARVYDTLRRLGAEGVRALILDLRHCPGGDLLSAIELAGDFLDEGALIATITDAEGDETVHRARRERLYAFPLALLVDGRTASAAEVFAGCLKAHGRAVIVGRRTYGKGSAQQVVPGFAAPGAWYATVASITLPDGAPIEGRGVDPDHS